MLPLVKRLKQSHFEKPIISKLTGLTKGQLRYIEINISLVIPEFKINGVGTFYNFNQLIELKLIQKLNKQHILKFTQIKTAKQKLKDFSKEKNLTDKAVKIDYGEIYLFNSNELKPLFKKGDPNQLSLIKYFLLEDIEKELDRTAKILELDSYFEKKEIFLKSA